MAGQNEFPKSDGDTIYSADDNLRYQAAAEALHAAALEEMNVAYDGDFDYTLFGSDPEIDTATSEGVLCPAYGTFIASGNILDNIDDSSIDPTIWTTSVGGGAGAAVTEDTDKIFISGGESTTSTLSTDGTSGFYFSSGTYYVLFVADFGTSGSEVSRINIEGDTTSVNIANNMAFTKRAFLLVVDATGELATLYYHSGANAWTAYATDVDISGAGTNKFLVFESHGRNDGNINLYKICYYTADTASDLLVDDFSLSQTCSVGMLNWSGYENSGTAIVGQLSLDGGSNYKTMTAKYPYKISNTGSTSKMKFILNTNGNETPQEITWAYNFALP